MGKQVNPWDIGMTRKPPRAYGPDPQAGMSRASVMTDLTHSKDYLYPYKHDILPPMHLMALKNHLWTTPEEITVIDPQDRWRNRC